MPLGVGDILQRSAVLGSLGLAVYAAVMTGQGWQERLGRRRQAYQDQLEVERQKAFDMGFPTQSTQTGSAPS